MLTAALVMVSAMAVPASAQVFTGRIEVTAVDSTGAVLPGVTVDVTGNKNQTLVTGADGVARFLNVEPGTYQVKATLTGFRDYINKSVPVASGANVALKAALAVGGVQEQVEVTAQTPVIDAKKTGTSTTVTIEELQNIPSARDPWVVMQTVPGIIVDRVNVGGSESGQQSNYQAKGASGGDATWNLDGVPITDMAATGSTPTYFDFDMFQEMNVTTGGADITAATGGVALNLVLRSGSNTPHGNARIYFENEKMQSNNMSSKLATDLGSPNGKGNRTSQYSDYGFDLGGPIVKNKLWAWGSVGQTDVRILTIKQTPDRTILKNRALKLQAQATENTRASFTYFFGDKNKFGRGASPTRPPETTFNQTGPTAFYKGEVNFVVGNNLFLTGRASFVDGGFQLAPVGGLDKNIYIDDSGVWHNTTYLYKSDRPQYVAMAEGSYFRGAHELKFGYSWRRSTVNSSTIWPGNHTLSIHIGYPDMYVQVASDHITGARANYQSLWLGDTISLNRATINAGVRFDWQKDGVLETKVPAVAGFEKYLPALTGKAVPNAIKWNSFSPRVGISYALDENRKTQVRGSYAMFASQLGNGSSEFIGVIQYRYAYFYGVDTNGNRTADLNEIDPALDGWYGFDPTNPGKLESVNKLGNLRVPKTHEVIAGLDRELFKNFGVSASFTWRKYVDFNWRPNIGVTRAMYVQSGTFTAGPLPDGSNASVPYYAVDRTKLPAAALTGGLEWKGRDGYHQRFWGIEASATKRLSNRWMARFGFSTNDHREYFDDPNASIQNPTAGPTSPNIDGGLVVRQTGGSGKSGIYMLLPKFQFIANGLYQAPWGLDLGVNLLMRQGFGQPWFRSSVTTGDLFSNRRSVLLASDVGKNRLPAVTTVDLRLGKALKFGRVTANIDLDLFNLMNSGTVLGKQYDFRITGVTGFDKVLEIMNPRIARIGVRVGF
jgi:hypothetical protein